MGLELGLFQLYLMLPSDKILHCSKLRAFAEGKTFGAHGIIPIFHRVENIFEKEKACYQYFFFSHNTFKAIIKKWRYCPDRCGISVGVGVSKISLIGQISHIIEDIYLKLETCVHY